jgi:hypothetical protein
MCWVDVEKGQSLPWNYLSGLSTNDTVPQRPRSDPRSDDGATNDLLPVFGCKDPPACTSVGILGEEFLPLCTAEPNDLSLLYSEREVAKLRHPRRLFGVVGQRGNAQHLVMELLRLFSCWFPFEKFTIVVPPSSIYQPLHDDVSRLFHDTEVMALCFVWLQPQELCTLDFVSGLFMVFV